MAVSQDVSKDSILTKKTRKTSVADKVTEEEDNLPSTKAAEKVEHPTELVMVVSYCETKTVLLT